MMNKSHRLRNGTLAGLGAAVLVSGAVLLTHSSDSHPAAHAATAAPSTPAAVAVSNTSTACASLSSFTMNNDTALAAEAQALVKTLGNDYTTAQLSDDLSKLAEDAAWADLDASMTAEGNANGDPGKDAETVLGDFQQVKADCGA